MGKNRYQVMVSDEAEIQQLEAEFQTNRAKVEQKIYSSVTEERMRTNKIIVVKKIRASKEAVFMAIAKRAVKDLHPALDYADLKPNTFYHSSGRTNKLPFKITEFVENEVMTIEYYAKDQQFIKALRFKANAKNTTTKIIYTDLTVGLVSVLGWFEKHIRSVYIKRQVIAFKAQVLHAELDLNLIPANKVAKKQAAIERMMEYAQKAF